MLSRYCAHEWRVSFAQTLLLLRVDGQCDLAALALEYAFEAVHLLTATDAQTCKYEKT